jgi:DNA-binding PadR family transcriptional regulator
MRRKSGALLAIEAAILNAALELRRRGLGAFHGFLMATELKEHGDTRTLTAYGTLYKALDRMERAGLLASRWEEAGIAEAGGRPRRRLYEITALGEEAAVRQHIPVPGAAAEAVP